jgi:hypothetical protein
MISQLNILYSVESEYDFQLWIEKEAADFKSLSQYLPEETKGKQKEMEQTTRGPRMKLETFQIRSRGANTSTAMFGH